MFESYHFVKFEFPCLCKFACHLFHIYSKSPHFFMLPCLRLEGVGNKKAIIILEPNSAIYLAPSESLGWLKIGFFVGIGCLLYWLIHILCSPNAQTKKITSRLRDLRDCHSIIMSFNW